MNLILRICSKSRTLLVLLWRCVSHWLTKLFRRRLSKDPKKTIAVNIEEMLDRVGVIDNRGDEIEDLVDKLKGYDISVDKFVVGDDYSTLREIINPLY